MIESEIPAFIAVIYDSPLATYVRESELAFPVLQTFHALGIMVMVGTIALVDLRILGLLLRDRTISDVSRTLLPLTWAGFVVMLISGGTLLAAQSGRIYANDFLRAKLILLAVAGVNVALFHLTTHRTVQTWTAGKAPVSARGFASASLVLWAAIVVTGRYIAYY